MSSDKKDISQENDAFIMSALLDNSPNRISGPTVSQKSERSQSQVQIKCEYKKETHVLTLACPVNFMELMKKVRILYRLNAGVLDLFMTMPNGEILTAVASQSDLDWALNFMRSCHSGTSTSGRIRSLRLLLTLRSETEAATSRKRHSNPPGSTPILGNQSRSGDSGRAHSVERGSPPPGWLQPEEVAEMERSPSMTASFHSEGEFIPDVSFSSSPAHSVDSSYSGSRASLFDSSSAWLSRHHEGSPFPPTRPMIGGTYPKRIPPSELTESHGGVSGGPTGRQTFPRVRAAVLNTNHASGLGTRADLTPNLSFSATQSGSGPTATAPMISTSQNPVSRRSHSSSTSSGITSSMDSPAMATGGASEGSGGRFRSDDDAAPLTPVNWQRGRLLGRGAFGQVHLCKDTETGREFAMKEVLFGDNGSTGEVSRQTAALENEIRLFRSLSHRALVQYFGAARDERGLYIFMEYMPGGSVKDEIKQYGELTETLTRRYTRQILKGLIFLHQATIIHRDIKAANILRDSAGNVKLADFGAARQLQTICTFSGAKSFCGTPFWMAPEVIRGEPYNTAADVWSLACTIVEMITRNPPWHELEPMAALFRIATVAKPDYTLPDDASSALKDFLTLAFRSNAKSRPSAESLIEHMFCSSN